MAKALCKYGIFEVDPKVVIKAIKATCKSFTENSAYEFWNDNFAVILENLEVTPEKGWTYFNDLGDKVICDGKKPIEVSSFVIVNEDRLK
jgi:hypothetical protein